MVTKSNIVPFYAVRKQIERNSNAVNLGFKQFECPNRVFKAVRVLQVMIRWKVTSIFECPQASAGVLLVSHVPMRASSPRTNFPHLVPPDRAQVTHRLEPPNVLCPSPPWIAP